MKKFVSLILCAILAFSVLTCVASAQDAGTTSDPFNVTSLEVPPTERSTEYESVFDEFFGDNIRDKTDEAFNFLEVMRRFFEKVVDFFKAAWDYVIGLYTR